MSIKNAVLLILTQTSTLSTGSSIASIAGTCKAAGGIGARSSFALITVVLVGGALINICRC